MAETIEMILFNDPKAQYESMRGEIDAAIAKVFDRGWFILGPASEEFERAFAAYCGVDFGVGVASGTEALQLALLAGGLREGDEVVTVANTAVPTVSAIRSAQGIPIFVDVEPDTYTMDPALLEAAITPRTRAVIPVHLYGQCAAMGPILEIAERHGLVVIEDCAQAHGALWEGRKAGSMGHFGCFSYYPTKNLGAYGDAGMIVTRDKASAERLKLLRNYGQTRRYEHSLEGINSRLDEIQAAILSVKLKHLDSWNTQRRRLAALYTEELAKTPLILPSEQASRHHVYHLYVVRASQRDGLQQFLAEREIQTLVHYPLPVYRQKAYTAFAPPAPLKVTEKQAGQIVSLPLFPELPEDHVRGVASAIRDATAIGLIETITHSN